MELPIALERGLGQLRTLRPDDAEAIATYANNRNVWLNLRDRFPHPYSLADAEEFISACVQQRPPAICAIDVRGEAVGTIGLVAKDDVERVSAELGYWIAEPFWGRGLATAAVKAIVRYAFETFDITRIYAICFGWNAASAHVLEKAGFHLEGRMRRSAVKEGQIIDQLQYGINDTDIGNGASSPESVL